MPRSDKQDAAYKNLDNDPRGLWRSDNLTRTEYRARDFYAIVAPKTKQEFFPPKGSSWRHPEDEMKKLIADNRIWFGLDGQNRPAAKRFLSEVKQGVVASGWWPFSEVGHTDESKKEVQALFEKVSPFDTPKPIRLINRMFDIGISDAESPIVLDFFAGSGSTGHAVLARNATTNRHVRYILVQLPEPLNPDQKEQKLGADCCDQLGKPRTIAELTKERLRRAGAKVKADNPLFSGDTGFRVFKLDSSNIRAWQPTGDIAQDLVDNMQHLQVDRTDNDVLYELLLKLGLDLCVPIEVRTIEGKTVHSIGAGVLMACLDAHVGVAQAEALALGMAAWHKELAPAGDSTAVFRDSAFENDVAKSNLAAILEQHGIKQVRSL